VVTPTQRSSLIFCAGPHGEVFKNGNITLPAGSYAFRIDYNQVGAVAIAIAPGSPCHCRTVLCAVVRKWFFDMSWCVQGSLAHVLSDASPAFSFPASSAALHKAYAVFFCARRSPVALR